MKKRYLKIKKAVLLMALCFILTPSLIAQTTSVDSLRMQYDSLDAKYFPSGILYNRSPHFLYCFKYDSTFQWLSNPDFSANPYKYDVGYHDYKKSIFDMMYEDMLYSSNNDTILIQRSLYNTNDSIAKSAYDFPISLMQINFNTLRLDALKEQHIHFDTLNNVYTIMPDTFYVNDSIYTLIQNPDSLAYLAFDNDDVYAATSTRSVIYKEFIKTHLDTIWKFGIDITYQLPLGLFVHNDGQAIPTVQIDFDDGNGFVNVNWNSSKTINYSDTILDNGHGVPVHYGFCKAYPKVLRVKFPSLQNDLIMSFPVKIVGMDHLSDTIIKTSTLPFLCSINEPNYTPSEEKVSIRYADKQVHELSKPIIVVEGFESALNDYGIISYEGLASGYIYDDDGNRAYDWLEEMKILFDSLHVLGYDIIYIDPKDPRTWIQRNGLSTIKVIQWANSRLDTNLSNEKLVVMGASMGGLIVRYSLRKMELAGCCHNTRLYVTFDTPHQKANIPVGDQHFVKDVGKAFKFITTSAYDSYHGALNSPAARQMLAYHIESTAVTDRDNWQAVLDSLGHPQNCRRIALISGSENGTAHSLNSPNSELLRMQIPFILPYEYKGWIPPPVHNWILMPKVTNLINFRAFSESQDTVYYGNEPSETLKNITFSLLTYGVTGTALTFADALSVNPAWTLPMQAFKIGAEYGAEHLYDKFYNRSMELNVYPNTSYPLVYTTAPGGLSDTQKSIEDVGYGLINAKTPNHTFIPSVSALDLNTSSLYMDIKSSYLADQSITSFDCYWATQRSDASPKENMMHVEVNSDNRAWIQDQILNDWELRAPNGEYKGVLTDYYNYGRPDEISPNRITIINNPYQTILYTLDIENNGVLNVNKQDVIGLSTATLLPRNGSTFKLKTNCEPCDSTIVKIKDGGRFNIGEDYNGVLNIGEVRFCKNSVLEIFNNGQLLINDSSSLIIEAGATLIIHKGAYIELSGSNAVLEIRGKIVIDDNAALKPHGTGFIRFAAVMNTNNYNDFWEVGSGSSLVLVGHNNNLTKKAEVIENLFIPDSLNQYFVNAQIEIDSMNSIYSFGSIQAQNTVFTALDTTKFYYVMGIYGQANTRFGNCEFKFGNYGLHAAMNYGGNTFILDTCTFTKNYIGLYTTDQHISLNSCKLNNNLDYGWRADYMQANCDVFDSEFNFNGSAGIRFHSQFGVILNIRESQLNDNYQHGVEIDWGELQANCSQFNRNAYAGIYAKEDSEINLSGISKNSIRFNNTGILFNKTKSVLIENGYNDFSGNQYYLLGELMSDNYYIPNTSPYGIDIDHNLMPATFNNTLPINIYFFDQVNNVYTQLPLNGWTQSMTSLQCICVTIAITDNYDNYKMFEGKITTALISTDHFPNTYLIDAIKGAAMQMSYGDNYIGNDTLAILMFKEIFDTIPPSINEDEQWAIDQALGLMITALTNAIEQDLIDPNRAMDGMPVDEYVGMIADEIQSRLNDVDYANLYAEEQEAYYQLLLAQMYRAAEHYDYALSILQNDNYFFNTTLQNQANYWSCICNAENLLLKDSIERPEYELQIDSCHALSTMRKAGFMPIFGETKVNPSSSENQILGIYPNPAEQFIAVEFSQSVKQVHIQLSNLSGKLIWETAKKVNGKQLRIKLPSVSSGAYMLKTTTESQEYNNKIIIK